MAMIPGEAPVRSRWRRCGTCATIGFAALVVTVAAARPLSRAWARDVAVVASAARAQRLAALEEAPPLPRTIPAFFGEPGQANAAAGYRAAVSAVRRAVPAGPGELSARLTSAGRPLAAHVKEGTPLDPAAARFLSDIAPAISFAVDYVRAADLDWKVKVADGFGVSHPVDELRVLLDATTIAAWTAEDDRLAVWFALAQLLLGRDVARWPGCLGAAVDHMAQLSGQRCLARLLARPLDEDLLAELADALDAIERTPLSRKLAEERVMVDGLVLAHDAPDLKGKMPEAFWAWEWRRCDAAWVELEGYLTLPPVQRIAAVAAFDDRSYQQGRILSLVRPLVFPLSLATLLLHHEQAAAGHDALRVLVAACRFAREEGRPPRDARELEPLLHGRLPFDPLRPDGGELTVRIEERRVVVYTWGRDGVDGGGDVGPPTWSDYGFEVVLPP